MSGRNLLPQEPPSPTMPAQSPRHANRQAYHELVSRLLGQKRSGDKIPRQVFTQWALNLARLEWASNPEQPQHQWIRPRTPLLPKWGLSSFRHFIHSGLDKPKKSLHGLTARLIRGAKRLVFSILAKVRPLLTPVLSRFRLGRKVLSRIPIRKPSHVQEQQILAKRLRDQEQTLEWVLSRLQGLPDSLDREQMLALARESILEVSRRHQEELKTLFQRLTRQELLLEQLLNRQFPSNQSQLSGEVTTLFRQAFDEEMARFRHEIQLQQSEVLEDHVRRTEKLRLRLAHKTLVERLRVMEQNLDRLQESQRRLEERPAQQPRNFSTDPSDESGILQLKAMPMPDLEILDSEKVVIGSQGFDFRDWEDKTRGEESAIREKQALYLPYFLQAPGPILDAGCGRGEFLGVLQAQHLSAYGIDLDESMVRYCKELGLHAERAELLSHLRQLPDNHLGGLFAGQVVEHLPTEALQAFVNLAYKKLAPGGVILLETINPQCLTVFSGAFYADPTHTKPVHPEAIEFFLLQAGFGPVTILPVSPIPEANKLAMLAESEPIDPIFKDLVLQTNRNFQRLNDVLYKPADYAALTMKPRTD